MIVNTISPDIAMNLIYGELPTLEENFINLFYLLNLPSRKRIFPIFTGNEKFTRLVEYKKITKQKYDENTTIIGMEIPVY